MKTTKELSRIISRVSAVVILLVAFTTISFAGDLVEDELIVESWMTTPFEISAVEGELALETWMTTPFGVSDCLLTCCN
jgi:hypothetical protein